MAGSMLGIGNHSASASRSELSVTTSQDRPGQVCTSSQFVLLQRDKTELDTFLICQEKTEGKVEGVGGYTEATCDGK